MARVDDDVIPEAEGTLVFIAANVREARRVEDLLTARGVDYCLSFETYLRAGLFAFLGSAEQTGVGFTVATERAESTRGLLRENGLRTGIVDDEA